MDVFGAYFQKIIFFVAADLEHVIKKIMEILQDENLFSALAEKSNALMNGLKEAGRAKGIPVQTTVYGAMMGFFFADQPVRNYTEALRCDVPRFVKFFQSLLNDGVYLAPSAFEAAFVSTAHTDQDIDRTLEAMRRAMAGL